MTKMNQAPPGLNDGNYLLHLGRTQGPELTPYSAQSTVSSFNLPIHYDHTLVTPVSLSSSPAMTAKSAIAMIREPDIKLSPGSMSPSYHMFDNDDDYPSRYNPPMKHKDPHGALQISNNDSFFPPGSPYVHCSSPAYFGAFTVSAMPQSSRTSNSSPTFLQSPNLHSAGGYSSGSFHSRNQTPALSATSYRSAAQTPIHIAPSPSSPPILIAPSPSILRQSVKQEGGLHRRSSLQSNISAPFHQGPSQGVFSQDYAPSQTPKKGLKRKTSPGLWAEIEQRSEELQADERQLLEWSVRLQLPWKEIEDKYCAMYGKRVKEATLQMRKKRLIDKFLVWTDREEKALIKSYEEHDKTKWSSIAKGMQKHGAQEKWSTEACQSKFKQLESTGYKSSYDSSPQKRQRTSSSDLSHLTVDERSWLDGEPNTINSIEDSAMISALSTATMADDQRGRTASDSALHTQHQQRQHQHQLQQQQIYERNQSQSGHRLHQQQLQRHNSWTPGH